MTSSVLVSILRIIYSILDLVGTEILAYLALEFFALFLMVESDAAGADIPRHKQQRS